MAVYGRGIWIADLEHPSDRYFENGFPLKEFSYLDGRRTIGIDTEWTIPLYYYFKWTVNGDVVTDCPYSYLRRRLNPGDRIQLELTLRESPDVHTLSAVYTIPEGESERPNETDENPMAGTDTAGQNAPLAVAAQEEGSEAPVLTFDNSSEKQPGRAIYSNGRGRIDLGYFDYFFNDFTIDMWIKPVSDGTILATEAATAMPKAGTSTSTVAPSSSPMLRAISSRSRAMRTHSPRSSLWAAARSTTANGRT